MRGVGLPVLLVWLCCCGIARAQQRVIRVADVPQNAFTVPDRVLRDVTLADRTIPESYWGAPLRLLKPVRVYRDRDNIAVVVKEQDHEERGIYYSVPTSSYLPVDEAGRKFTWNAKLGRLEYVFKK